MKTKILYIEDELNLGKIVCDTLRLQGFEVVWETDGALALAHFNNFSPDLCVLDVMLPNIDGYVLCQQIKAQFPSLPIIFLTAKVDTVDLVKGFECGGSDYMRKPFSIEELIVRINNLILIHKGAQKSELQQDQHEELRIGKYKYLPKFYELLAPSGTIKLSNREGEVLQLMVSKGSQVIERKELLLSIWGDDSFFNSRNLDVYIKKLRNYFSEDSNIEIQTLRGKGYLFIVR